jgi:hypothetical protein
MTRPVAWCEDYAGRVGGPDREADLTAHRATGQPLAAIRLLASWVPGLLKAAYPLLDTPGPADAASRSGGDYRQVMRQCYYNGLKLADSCHSA